MSILSDHNRWLAGCRHVSNKGTHLTPGDIFHCGLGDYVESMRCPNGMPVDTRTPNEVPSWRRRVEKARAFLARCRESDFRDDLSELLTDDDVFHAIERVKQWENKR